MAEKKVARVTLNGETLMDVTQDSVSPEVLAENETAHNHAGEPIVGSAQIVDGTYYNTNDPASTDIDDADYIPFNDVSDSSVPKKKTTLTSFIEKLKSILAPRTDVYQLASGKYNALIRENEDLNNYTTAGTYDCRYASIAQSLSNCPVIYAFKLQVDIEINPSIVSQTITLVNDKDIMSFKRTKTNDGVWGSWYQLLGRESTVVNDSKFIRHDGQWKVPLLDGAQTLGTADMNDITEPGYYYHSQGNYTNITNAPPVNDSYWYWVIDSNNGDRVFIRQIAFRRTTNDIYTREIHNDNTWTSWQSMLIGNGSTSVQPSIGSGYCEGTVSGTAITATIDNFVLTKGGIIVLKMSVQMPTGATLNISNTGAKDIYWANGTALKAYDMPCKTSNMTWILSYDGTRYLIVGVSKSATVIPQNYVADTSGNIVLNAFYDSNAFQFKHRIEPNDLVWNRFKNGAWHGDVKLVDYEDLLDCSQVVSGGILASHKIVSTDDLNDYTASGTYQYAYSNDGLPANCPLPLNRSFKLIVDRYNNDSRSEICQRITMVNTSSTEHWLDWYRFRMWNQSTWGDWMQVANVADSAQLNKINAIDITSGNLNDYKTPGTYYFTSGNYPNITNVPPINDSYMIWVMNTNGDTSYYRQIAFARANSAVIYSRIYNNGNWTPWALIYSEVNFGISISSNANLNDYTTPGVYKIATNNEAATMSNIPVKVAGKLIVMEVAGGTYRVQQYIPYNIAYTNNHGLMYQRSWNNDSSANTWSDWIKYADYRDLNQSVAHTGKNLLPQKSPYNGYIDNGGTHTTNGITYTFNSDGSVTANGTATADSILILCPDNYGYMFPKGSYVLSGCPSGGSSSKYYIELDLYTRNNTANHKFDYGSGSAFTLTEDCTQGTYGSYMIKIKSGQTVSNLVFKPMIRHAYTDATYEKYIPNGQDVKGVVYVGTCSTAADQQVKVVNVDSDFRLKKGVRIAVKFSNTNTYNSTTSAPCQLNVNGTGARNIYYNNTHSGAGYTGTNTRMYGVANRYIYYLFDGSYWVWDGCTVDDNSTNFLRNDAASTMSTTVPQLSGKSTEINAQAADNGVSTTRYPTMNEILDKNGLIISRDETTVQSNGNIRHFWYVRNYNGSTTQVAQKGLWIEMDKNGAVTWGFHDPQYFNAALGEGYGTCSTAADQQVKAVTCAKFVLCVGAVIHVRFTNTNTYNSTTSAPVKLNVNSTGEKVIYYNNNPGTSSNTGTNTRIYGEAGRTFTYMYDGIYWVWLGCGYEADTVDPRALGFGHAICDTAAATVAKDATLASYNLRNGGYVTVYFQYDVPANATLNINSKGAKNIWYKGANITAGKIRGGDRATFFYDGTRYQLIGIDSEVPDINTCITMSDCDWSATLKSKCTMATSGGVWAARMINNNFLYVSVEVGYTNAVAATIPSYGQTTTEVFFRIKNKFKECLNISEVMVDLNGVVYPAFAGIYTVDNVSCVTVALRKPASLVAGSGNIRFTFILPCKRI